MTVELAGTGPLKILHTVNIDMWRHPSYYKKLRSRNKSDQAISPSDSTEPRGVRPGPGQKPQATSCKQQAVNLKINLERVRKQYTSCKQQASSLKHQAVQKK